MKALVYHGKESIALEEMELPKLQEGEALIKVHYAGICGSDLNIWHGALSRIVPPVILGHEFCGEIVEVKGQAKGDLKVGDPVAVEPLINCGICMAALPPMSRPPSLESISWPPEPAWSWRP